MIQRLEQRTLLSTSYVSVADASLVEGNSGTSDMVFAVTRSGDMTTPLSISYTTVDGMAKAGVDYVATSGTLDLAAGQAAGAVRVPVIGNSVYQYNRTFSLRLSNAAPQFASPQNYTVAGNPMAVAVGDFNNDGRMDVAVACASYGYVSVLLGRGDGTFQMLPNVLSVGGHPRCLVADDVNGDGKTDLVTTDSQSTLVVCLGKGDGTFSTGGRFLVGELQSVAVGDFDHDSAMDLAAADASHHTVRIVPGRTNVGSPPSQDFTVGGTPGAVAAGDFNGDGSADVVVTTDGYVKVLLGSMTDSLFEPPTASYAQADCRAIITGDFNEDGRTDVAVTAYPSGSTVNVLLGNGDGRFQMPMGYPAGPSPWSVAVGDLNGDGHADLVVANYSGTGGATVLTGSGDGTFRATTTYATGIHASGVACADFNGDGRADLAVASSANALSVLLNTTPQAVLIRSTVTGTIVDDDPPPSVVIASTTLAEGDSGTSTMAFTVARGGDLAAPLSIHYTTVDGTAKAGMDYLPAQGTLDFAAGQTTATIMVPVIGNARCQADRAFSVLLSNATPPQFVAASTWIPGSGLPPVAVSDYNADGILDIATTDYEHNAVSVLLGNGDGTFRSPMTQTVSGPVSVASGDFNADGMADLAVGCDHAVCVLLGNGDGTFRPADNSAVACVSPSLTARDLNGDGRDDLVAADEWGSSLSVLLGVGDGAFQVASEFAVACCPHPVATGDFNGDGIIDLAIGTSSITDSALTDKLRVLLGRGDGTFQDAWALAMEYGPLAVAAADFNGDGRDDLATDVIEGVSTMLATQDGSFLAPVTSSTNTPYHLWLPCMAVGDFNGDDMADVAMGGWDTHGVLYVFMGQGDGRFETPIAYVTDNDPFGLAAADLNGDGRTDLLVGDSQSDEMVALLNVGPCVAFDPPAATGTISDDDSPAIVRVAAGEVQSTPADRAFDTVAVVSVTNARGQPVEGVPVVFAASADGPSAYFDNGSTATVVTAVTDATGKAAAPVFIANPLEGTYSITATAGTVLAVFTLTNTPALPSSITTSGNARYTRDPATGDLALTSGTLTFAADAAGTQVTATGTGASVVFDASQHLASLSLSNGASATLAGHGRLLRVGSLSLAGGATLNLGDNDLIVDIGQGPETPDGVLSAVVSAITARSLLASTASPYAGLGAILNAQGTGKLAVGQFDGEDVGADCVLVKYTYLGDADLNGRIDAADYLRADYGLLTGKSGWRYGDVDYSGSVTADDFASIDAAYLNQGPPLGSAAASKRHTARHTPSSIHHRRLVPRSPGQAVGGRQR